MSKAMDSLKSAGSCNYFALLKHNYPNVDPAGRTRQPLRWRRPLLAVCCLVFAAFSSPDFLFRKRPSASSYADNDAFRNIKQYGAVLAEIAPSAFTKPFQKGLIFFSECIQVTLSFSCFFRFSKSLIKSV